MIILLVFIIIVITLCIFFYIYYDEIIKKIKYDNGKEKKNKSQEKTKEEKRLTVPEIHSEKNEVFHVADRKFNYEEAKDVCQQYGARLANYDELVHHYQHGGEFCNHGWSENQLALYPTSKSTWQQLQNSNPRFKDICGHYGINGGKFPKHMKFGANCYGKRPPKPDSEFIYPSIPTYRTQKEKRKRKQFKDVIVVPFNKEQWARNIRNPNKQHHHTFTTSHSNQS